jgi:hypothetical protein
MNEQKNNRTKWVNIRLTEDELAKINKQFANSVCQKLSEYVRKKLLDKPVVVRPSQRRINQFNSSTGNNTTVSIFLNCMIFL